MRSAHIGRPDFVLLCMNPLGERLVYLVLHVLPIVALLYLIRAAIERATGLSLRYPSAGPVFQQRRYWVVIAVAGIVFGWCYRSVSCYDCPSPEMERLSVACLMSTIAGWIAYVATAAAWGPDSPRTPTHR